MKPLAWPAIILAPFLLQGCRTVQPQALPHPQPADAWRSGVAVESPPPSAPVQVQQEELPEDKPVDRSTLSRQLLQEITLHAEATTLRQILLTLAKQAHANVTVDSNVTGSTSVQFTKVPLIDAIEELASTFKYRVDAKGGFVHVYRPGQVARLYQLSFPGAARKGDMKVSVSDRVIAASSQTPMMGGATGMPAGAPGGGAGAMGSTTSIEANSTVDPWQEITVGLKALVLRETPAVTQAAAGAPAAAPTEGGATQLTDSYGHVVVVSPNAGTVEVRAEPQVQQSVRQYLDQVQSALQRQVVIEARMLEVTLNDKYEAGINWQATAKLFRGKAGLSITQATPANPLGALTFSLGDGTDLTRLMAFLAETGRVDTISAPHIAVTNNQKAVIKVVKERTFFLAQAQPTVVAAGGTTLPSIKQFMPIVVNEGVVLDVTPEIGADDWVTMNIHPSLAEVADVVCTPNGCGEDGSLPEMTRREFATVVRIPNNQTVVIGGLMSHKTERDENGVPFLKDLWLVGHLFRDTKVTTTKTELVLLLTPRVVNAASFHDLSNQEVDRLKKPDEQEPLTPGGGHT